MSSVWWTVPVALPLPGGSEGGGELGENPGQGRVLRKGGADLGTTVEHGGMIAVTENPPNLGEGQRGLMPQQVHRHVPS